MKDNYTTDMYLSGSEVYAKQIIRKSFESVLCGTFRITSLEEMKAMFQKNFRHDFDEYKAIQLIKRSHPEWEQDKVDSEMESEKKFGNEILVNLQVAALNAIDEIEKLITSLNNSI